MAEATIALADPELALILFGTRDQHLRTIRESLGVSITHRGDTMYVSGDDPAVARATSVLEQLKALGERRRNLSHDDVQGILLKQFGGPTLGNGTPNEIAHTLARVKPRTEGQARYVQAMREHDVVFAIGPAGTGKTYLAVAMAIEALKARQVRKIVLCRPAVEAGESLGYLPGDLRAKINPYLRPLLDSLHDMIDFEQAKRLLEQDVIEVIPLAYMRGRTLNEAVIILDEGQNATISQMKMFLTRMGHGSKIIVSGDVTQVDLPTSTKSGLLDAVRRLQSVRGVSVVELGRADIVRHPLVQQIVDAYDEPMSPPQPPHSTR
ncbi:MAG: PhoH family protein [Planctomycetota bacterium]